MQQERYVRQIGLEGFGLEGQTKLSEAKVLVVGLGGLGLPALQYLNAMGIGTLGLVDHDIIALHNLQRQVLYTENDLGKPKLEVAISVLSKQNSNTIFKPYNNFLTKDNALDIISDFDLVVDATDNFSARYLINDACVLLNKPFVYGALHDFEGQVSVFNYKDGPTYRCLFPKMPGPMEIPNCDENGVLGVIPGIIGTFQALEVIKIVTGIGEVLSGKLLLYSGMDQRMVKINFKTNPVHKNITKLQGSYEFEYCETIPSLSAQKLVALMDNHKDLSVVDVRSPKEYQENHLDGAINIPLQTLEKPNDIFSDTSIVYLICQSGKRSEIALKYLRKEYPNSSFCHILGGMNSIKQICQ
ncbi:MAG: HesA/MoeB/ThiF family protein [Flavobacteriaceae bacterium]